MTKIRRSIGKISATALLLISAAASLYLFYLYPPERSLVVAPSPLRFAELYGAPGENGEKSAIWLSEAENKWQCDYKDTNAYGCGWSIPIGQSISEGIDLTKFSTIEMHLVYTGPAKRIRASIKNFNPAYATPDDPTSFKTMNMTFSSEEAHKKVVINTSEFLVAGWWLFARKAHQEWMKPELTNTTAVGLDFIEPGLHSLKIEKIELVGTLIKRENILTAYLSFGVLLFLGQGLFRFYRRYRSLQENKTEIRELEEKQKKLEEQNRQLKTLSETDPLTGIINRTGLHSRVKALEHKYNSLKGIGVFIMDLDHFKQINDRYGHDIGDKVLKSFASTLQTNMRTSDIFARLGGEEFITICKRQSLESILSFAERLRSLANHCIIDIDDEPAISVSIGVSLIEEDNNLELAIKRADQGLYKAKESGRNKVCLEGGDNETLS